MTATSANAEALEAIQKLLPYASHFAGYVFSKKSLEACEADIAFAKSVVEKLSTPESQS